MNIVRTQRIRDRLGGRLLASAAGFSVLMMILLLPSVYGQNFVNTGSLQNSGTFRVRSQATGLPDSVGGTFEYFGAGQQIPAVNYTTLRLSGDAGSVKTTIGGDFTVFQETHIQADVTLQVSVGSVMALDKNSARLTEEGSLFGRVRKSADLFAPADSSDFGGIGLSLRSTAGIAGSTTVLRTSGVPVLSNGHSSIRRTYEAASGGGGGFRTNVYFEYRSSDLAGQSPATFNLWRSPDAGASWRRQHSIARPSLQRVEGFDLRLDGLWTAADENNLLGRPNFEGDPDSVSASGADSLRGRVRRYVPPFFARITDVFGNPIVGTTVNFQVASKPAGAVGDSLTSAVVQTDSLGQAATQLRLGSLRGRYEVLAQVASVPSASFRFIAEGTPGAIAIPIAGGNNQSDTIRTTLPLPLAVTARDSEGVVVDQVPVAFSVVSVPPGASGHRVSLPSDTTDAAGQASATFTLGNKAGRYILRATSPEIEQDSATFVLTATHGAPAVALADTLTRRDTIGAVVPEMIFTVTDNDTNAIPGRAVNFAIAEHPAGAVGDSLIAFAGITDSLGRAGATLRLGTRTGQYRVAASDPLLPGSVRAFIADALPGRPSSMTPFFSSSFDTIGATLPSIGFTVSDRGTNAVPAEPVSITTILHPPGAVGDSLVVPVPATDGSGQIFASIKLGDKAGDYILRAAIPSTPGLASDLTLRALPGVPARIIVDGGDGQAKTILQPLDSLFIAQLEDRAENPIANDTIHFEFSATPPGATGQVLSVTEALTDSLGRASTQLTLGSRIGEYRVFARSRRNPNVLREFTAVAVSGQPAIISGMSGDGQRKSILSLLDSAFVIRLTDVGSNPVPGVLVNFRIARRPLTAAGDSLTVTSAVTDARGEARTALALGTRIGEYVVAAVSSAIPGDTVMFRATALVGAPAVVANIGGSGQRAQVGDRLRPFEVRVADLGDNPISTASVIFRVTERPDPAAGDSLSVTNAPTDSAGRASTILTLGNRGGRYVVRATVPGAQDTSFIAEAIFVLADANHDNYQNIGDLTAIIDHILGSRILAGIDLLKADIDHNSTVDIRDAILTRDSLLAGVWDPVFDWTGLNLSMHSGTIHPSIRDREEIAQAPIEGIIQRTHIGSRLYLKNDVPVRGLQAILYLKHAAAVDSVDLIFPGARMMQVGVQSVGNTVNVVAYNLNNTPLPADTGSPIFRLPLKLNDVTDLDSVRFIVSIDTNVAVPIPSMVTDLSGSIPARWSLYQNYPNPFNGGTTIEFDIPEVAGKLPRIAVQIFDLLGRKVITIEKGFYDAANRYRVFWDGRAESGEHVSSGIYFYRLLGPEYTTTKKMILIK